MRGLEIVKGCPVGAQSSTATIGKRCYLDVYSDILAW